MARIHVTLREPVNVRVLAEKEKDGRIYVADMVSALVEEALDARDKKSGKRG